MIFLYDEQPGERFIPQWYPDVQWITKVPYQNHHQEN